MTDQRPSNAPDDLPDQPRRMEDAASILSDDDATPGGGGLGGADAGDALNQTSGASPNSPVDIAAAPGGEPGGRAPHDAARRATGDTAADPDPASN